MNENCIPTLTYTDSSVILMKNVLVNEQKHFNPNSIQFVFLNIITSTIWRREEIVKSINENFNLINKEEVNKFLIKNDYIAIALNSISYHIKQIFSQPRFLISYYIDPEYSSEKLIVKIETGLSFKEANKIMRSFYKDNKEIKDSKINKFISFDLV